MIDWFTLKLIHMKTSHPLLKKMPWDIYHRIFGFFLFGRQSKKRLALANLSDVRAETSWRFGFKKRGGRAPVRERGENGAD